MNNEQEKAIVEMNKWRDEMHSLLSTGEISGRDGGIFWIYLALRNVMNDVSVAFGQGSCLKSQDLDMATTN